MKYLFLMLCMFARPVSAQKQIIKEVRLSDKELQSVIVSSKLLRSIEFNKKGFDDLLLKPDTFSLAGKTSLFNYGYHLEYPGHQYLFEKQFGKFPMNRLLRILDSLKITSRGYNTYQGKIFADHISIKVTGFRAENTEDYIFAKVPELLEYAGGQPAFQKYLQEKINNSSCKTYLKNDSAFFFRAVLKRDSLIHDIRSFDSLQSDCIDFLKTVLKESPGWKPFEHGGRVVNKYIQLFILIRKDGTIQAGFY